jgi:acetyl-CoA carboxylase biotin carboxyl carrier protein
VTESKITYAELLQILELIKSTPQFHEVHLKVGDIEIDLSRGASPAASASPAVSPTAAAAPLSAAGVGPQPRPMPRGENQTQDAAASQGDQSPQTWPPHSILVRSPMVGTFFRASAPGAPPFVEIGRAVEPNTTVCIIEVMKLMSSIAAGARGTITHILVGNAEMVEHGQIIMVIEPR